MIAPQELQKTFPPLFGTPAKCLSHLPITSHIEGRPAIEAP
jgi:hypothetical protein